MNWALLNSRFFKQHVPQKDFWLKFGTLEEWNSQFVPLYEWQGLLFVGCSKEPPNWKSPQPVMFVLCEPEPLENYFMQLKALTPTSIKIPQKGALPKAPPPHEMPAMPPDKMPRQDGDPFAALNVLTTEPSTSSDDSASDLDLSEEKNEEVEVPELLLISDEALKTKDTKNILSPLSSVKNNELVAEKKEPSISFRNESSINKATNPSITITTSTGKKAEYAPHIASGSFSDKAFHQLKSQYHKCMILKKNGNAVTPWLWDSKFSTPAGPPQPISLGQPSPFRIVARTQKSYHGFVVPNELNEKFFDDWNQAQIPDHMTLSPIIINDEVIGMLLALGPKEINPKTSLQLAEKVAGEISLNLENNPTLLAG
jgi:hypothetical protein